MKFYKLLCILTGLIFIQNFYGQTADITEGCFPFTVNFTAPGGSSTYFWDFQDGATSTLQTPQNTFITAGVYTVEFRETPSGPTTGTVTINVYAKPIPEFTSDITQGCAPLTVSFNDATTLNSGITISGYSWVFGDGGTATGVNPSHTFNTEGNYFVSLGLTTNLASCDVTKAYNDVISLTNPPTVVFTTTPNPPSSCDSTLDVSFNNTSSASGAPLTYSWDLGNGNTSILTNAPTQTYIGYGTYPVILTATDTNGCARTFQKNVSLGAPTADFLVKDTVCINVYDTIFNLSSGGAYSWNFGLDGQLNPAINPGTSIQGYHQGRHPIIRFSTPGQHTVSLIVNAGGCADTISYDFYVEEIIADFTSNPTYSCEDPMLINFTSNTPNAVSYFWTFDTGDTSIVQNPSYTYEVLDTTTYSINGPNPTYNYFTTTLVVTSASGCLSTFSTTDTIHEPNALMMPDVIDGCLPLNVIFSDSSSSNEPIVNWEWFFGDGTSISANNDSPQPHTYTIMGEYHAFLVITNDAGCTDTSYVIPIKVGDVIVPDFEADILDVCPGDSIQFTDLTPQPLIDSVDAWHYTTEAGLMFHCFQEPNPKWSYTHETGPQDVTLTVGFNGCYSSTTKVGYINVKGPIAQINYFSTCETPYTIDFADSSRSATSIIWDFGDGDTTSIADPSHTYAVNGDYTVVLQAINSGSGCVDSYDTTTVHIRDIQANYISDSLLCQSTPYSFNAGTSQDVYEYCGRGYTWYFSDPGTRPIMTDDPNEPIPFPISGLNTVTLVVTDINGCKDTASSDVRVYGITADFDLDKTNICIPSLVTFNDTSYSDTTIVDWQWDFGDGQGYAGVDTSHTYTNAQNNFEVELTVTDEVGCTNTLSTFISTYSPISSIGVSDNTVCSGDSIYFSATDYTAQGSNLNFNWDFNDGNTGTGQTPTNSFASGGTYTVNLVYEEISTGCKDSTTQTIFVQDKPIAGFTTSADASPVICPNENVLFTNATITSSSTSYAWDFGNGNTSTFANPGSPYANNGTYTVQLIASTSHGCKDTTTRSFIVRGPSGDFFTNLMGQTICRLDSVIFTITDTNDVDTYNWDFADGTFASNISPIIHQYTYVPPSGQFVPKLTMSNADGSCPLSVDTIVNIYQVIADFDRNLGGDTAICFDDQPYAFTNTSLNEDTWFWDFGDGSTSIDENPAPHTYASPDTFQVTLGVQNTNLTCTDTITKDVIIFPSPIVTAVGDTICEGDAANLYAVNPILSWLYTWVSNPTSTILNDSTPTPTTQPIVTTDYTVTVKDSNGCFNSDNTTIYVINDILINDFDTTVAMGDDVILPVYLNAGLYDFTWTPEEGLSCLDCLPPTVLNPLEDIIYHLEITDIPKNCFSRSADYDIKIFPETFIKVPTTFTPNGDGVNDIIYAEGWGVKELIEFKIFNRWGELIFESNDMETGWDGYYKGVLQNNDVYVYKIQALTWTDETQAIEGHINLMR